MAKKQDNYIEYEIEFLEKKLEELKQYIEDRPFSNLEDRINYKPTAKGGVMPMVIASIEAQRKDLAQAMKDYADITLTVKKLREDESFKQIAARGQTNIPARMRKKTTD